MARRKNPRTLLIARTKALKILAESITHPMTHQAARTIYIPREERTNPGEYQRARKPEEHVDNRPVLWLQARADIISMAQTVREADVLVRFKLAQLGRDARGVDIGAREALGRLDPTDVATLIALEVWDGSLPPVP